MSEYLNAEEPAKRGPGRPPKVPRLADLTVRQETVFAKVVTEAREKGEEAVHPFYIVDELGRSDMPEDIREQYERMELMRKYVPLATLPDAIGPAEVEGTKRFQALPQGTKIDVHWREAERLAELGIAKKDFRGNRA